MVEDRIGKRYAKSAFSLAKEQGTLDPLKADMEILRDLVRDSKEFADFLVSPVIRPAKKQAVLDEIFAGKFQTELMPLLMQMVVRKGREMYLPQVAESFLAMYDEENGILRGLVTSATGLPDTILAEIQQKMEQETGKSFVMTKQVDPDLIGGFTLKVGNSLFDGSVRSSLRRLRQGMK